MEQNVIGSCFAITNKVQTTVDGGIRLTFDVDQSNVELVSNLLTNKNLKGGQVYIVITEENDKFVYARHY